MTKDEALKMRKKQDEEWENLIKSINKTLEQPAQEPVAWIKYVWEAYEEECDDDGFYPDIKIDTYDNGGDPLYTHPHQWQGLTDDEIEEILNREEYDETVDLIHLSHAIEQALKEKNHGLELQSNGT